MNTHKLALTASVIWAGFLFNGNANAAEIYQVASDATYAPFEALNSKKEVVGFSVEILEAIAQNSGMKVKFINTPWEGIFTTLATGERDLIISSVTITPERKQLMDFSEPYFEAKQLIAVGKNSTVGRFTDLKNLKIAVQTDTTGDEIAQKLQGKTSSNIKRFESTPQAIKELESNLVDAVLTDNGVIVNYLSNNPQSKLKIIDDVTFAKEYYGIAVNKGNTALLTKINKGLFTIKANGTYDKIYNKYFGK